MRERVVAVCTSQTTMCADCRKGKNTTRPDDRGKAHYPRCDFKRSKTRSVEELQKLDEENREGIAEEARALGRSTTAWARRACKPSRMSIQTKSSSRTTKPTRSSGAATSESIRREPRAAFGSKWHQGNRRKLDEYLRCSQNAISCDQLGQGNKARLHSRSRGLRVLGHPANLAPECEGQLVKENIVSGIAAGIDVDYILIERGRTIQSTERKSLRAKV